MAKTKLKLPEGEKSKSGSKLPSSPERVGVKGGERAEFLDEQCFESEEQNTTPKSPYNLEYVTQKLVDNIIDPFSPHGDNKTAMVKASDFINAIKVIADLNGLKVSPDNTFKGEQYLEVGE